jgi:RNA polymerase sigma-70 factor (ECF subfamily)
MAGQAGTVPSATVEADMELVERLRAGDEHAFVALVERYHAAMLRFASSFVPSAAIAEEVVQDTWLGLLRGIGKFEGRSSLKTWLFQILIRRARTTGVREHRSLPVADTEAAVDPSRFDETGHWAAPPDHWVEQADDRLHATMLTERIRLALDDLPARQRQVVLLRDVEGLPSEDICSLLDISESNQRVLLHRGRSRLRQALESEFGKV